MKFRVKKYADGTYLPQVKGILFWKAICYGYDVYGNPTPQRFHSQERAADMIQAFLDKQEENKRRYIVIDIIKVDVL